ncbi:hypothetical protein BU24DRAFT_381963 [Aaosphaeria arxii CBS 175.79]|uniref:UbiA prenyltransferase n=1 Tax=Aaosphaeria arxii CBS 175.79 TaxID=1450172 RepID=A0A6A5X5X0_9PLEO|nr:uncharacterized protein BU24DRAFT_381963 [Aaosphaeria arxii CBS 175.79]KAF2008395.1 hypothetical protein BU24DRAFT_381963 [Aaosphaeria arxii CBS 175.79]
MAFHKGLNKFRSAASAFSLRNATYHLHTLWLFTCDQNLDVILPCTVFAISAAMSGPLLSLPTLTVSDILCQSPVVLGWLWLMVLQCCLQNQRNETSVEEDRINKPWRPIPSDRLTCSQAERLLVVSSVMIAMVSSLLGVLPIWIIYTVAVIGYNDFGGGESNFVLRNAINSIGYACFLSSALKVAAGSGFMMTQEAGQWVGIMMLVIFTTIHAQDFRDEPGDSARGRSTIISAIGNTTARVALVAGILFWSIFIPLFMRAGIIASSLPWALGMGVAGMTLYGINKRNFALDAKMYKLWGVWMLSLTTMPLAHALRV